MKSAEKILANAQTIDVGDDWFDVIELPNSVFTIQEKGHLQEVCSFLIIGEEKALLFDTGMGISNIARVVERLTDLDIIIVNSHSHFDHIGDNWRFSDIHIFADDIAIRTLTEGYSHWDVRHDADPELFRKEYPPGFDLENYAIKAVARENIRTIQDGDRFDLGGRHLELLHTPGHSQDSIMLLDRDNRLLFTGDTFCEWIFAFFDAQMPKYGYSNLNDYARSMRDIAGLVPHVDYLLPSHGKPLADPKILIDVASAFAQILRGEAESYLENLYGVEVRVYEFEGFSICASLS